MFALFLDLFFLEGSNIGKILKSDSDFETMQIYFLSKYFSAISAIQNTKKFTRK
jgi:hypothetical protein